MARERSERLWIGGAAAVAFLVVLIGWFFLISPQRDETADVEGQVLNAQLQNDTLQARIAKLGGEKKAMAKYKADLLAAQEALPATSDMSAFLRTVQRIGAASGAKVTSLTVGTATAASPAAAAPAPSGSASTDPAATAPAAGTGIQQIPITASVTGTPAALKRFLVQLQSVQPRAVLLTGIGQTTQGDQAKQGAAGLQLTMQAFVLPAASGGSAAASATPSPSTTGG